MSEAMYALKAHNKRRDMFAAMAMQGMLSNSFWPVPIAELEK